MDSATYEQETEMCRRLNKENNGGCAWGRCETCGVIPLLYKLRTGAILETEDEIYKAKHGVFYGTTRKEDS